MCLPEDELGTFHSRFVISDGISEIKLFCKSYPTVIPEESATELVETLDMICKHGMSLNSSFLRITNRFDYRIYAGDRRVGMAGKR